MQTDYNAEMGVAFDGMLADSSGHDSISKVIDGDGLDFGLAATYGASEGQIKALSAITQKVAGIIMHKHVVNGVIAEKDVVALVRKGRIYVKVEEAVSEGDSVYVRAVAGAGEVAGAFRKSVDGTDTILLNGAEFRSGAAAGGLAIVEINLPA